MATSTLRAAILVAAVVVGAIVLKTAFPGNPSQTVTQSLPSTRPSSPGASPSPRVSPSPSGRKQLVKGVTVQVLNGTSTTGLAAGVSQSLKKAGYKVKTPGNVARATRTTIYYQPAFKDAAVFMRSKYFRKAAVAPAPSTFPKGVALTVVLGSDFSSSS